MKKKIAYSISVFMIITIFGLFLVQQFQNNRTSRRRDEITKIASRQADLIGHRLSASLSSTFALAAIVKQGGGKVNDFDQLAEEMLSEYQSVANFQLAPDAIVQYVYPLSGNEKAIGHNLLEDQKRKKEAQLAIDSRELVVAGPFELIQGGMACIGRYPIFLSDGDKDIFWGFSIALIRIPQLLNEVSIGDLDDDGYLYQIWNDSGDGKNIFVNNEEQLSDPVEVIIDVPNGSWTLGVMPKKGWVIHLSHYLEIGLVVIIGSLGGLITSRTIGQSDHLRDEIKKRTKELERVSEDNRNIADTLQQAVLEVPASVKGIEYKKVYHSATEEADVGGDFFNIFELEDDKVGIVIGDISGQGLQAATLNSIVKNAVKAYSYREDSPAKVVRMTDELVRRSSADNIFVSLFFCVLDVNTGKLIYCNAGHPAAILSKENSSEEILVSKSPVIGTFVEFNYLDSVTFVASGDTLVLYTDGVIEARESGLFYGEERLMAAIRASGPTDNIPEKILESIMRFTGNILTDDIAIVSIKLADDI